MIKGESNKPEISVVMSVFNDERFLNETLCSILNQTFENFEFIIINDGSSDKSVDIIKTYQKIDNRIKLIHNERNLGLIISLNRGLRVANGKYIARMDADDIALKERFEIQYNFLEKNIAIFLVGTHVEIIDETGAKLSVLRYAIGSEKISKLLPTQNCIVHPTIMFRNNKKHFYRDKMWYTEDYDFYLNCITAGEKLENIPQVLLKYRRNAASISLTNRGKQKLFGMKAKEFYLQRLQNGKDEYESFDADEILNMDLEQSCIPIVLKSEIKVSFAVNDLIKTRRLLSKYFKTHGYFRSPTLFVYYVATYMNVALLKKIKKFVKKLVNIIHRVIGENILT
jgi:glycosyltransferase involved in cell wall biosynthesis